MRCATPRVLLLAGRVHDGEPEEKPMSNMHALVTRERILRLLSDEEVAMVSMAEGRRLPEGEDYVDLEHPEDGVRKVDGSVPARPGDVLPRSAVKEQTWSAILGVVGR